MKSLLLFFLLCVLCLCSISSADDVCAFSREQALDCIKTYVDVNHDNVITLEELEDARSKYTSTLQKAASWLASWFTDSVSTPRIIKDCDFNHDGVFTPDDFIQATTTCLPKCRDLMLMKGVCEKAAAAAN